jgi:hypothetical protein
MDTLDDKELGVSVLTLQEAISLVELNQEGTLFQIKFKPQEVEEESQDRVIRVRISEITVDGQIRLILQISDFTDTINYQKL